MRPLARRAARSLTLVAVAACTPSATAVRQHNEAAYRRAVDRAAAVGGDALVPEQVVVGADPRYGGDPDDGSAGATRLPDAVAGGGPDDVLYRLPTGQLAFAGPTCAMQGDCACAIPITYAYRVAADGQVTVVRLRPRVKVYRIEVDACGYGCGQPPPPQPLVAAALPATTATQVRLVEETYRLEVRRETCANPIPAP
ncbi:MAG: hypothetical protein R3B06_26365 [Kofleriaceae bacterium]